MNKPPFELTNEQRRYLGLAAVEKGWKLVKLFDSFVYFDGAIIRKQIIVTDNSYYESALNEKTSGNRTILLPKTSRGKPKKLNLTASNSFSPFGVYFEFSSKGDIRIANYTTKTTYFYEKSLNVATLEDLKRWINQWILESTEEDLQEIDEFKSSKRQRCKFKEGDFFTFKIGRRKWGFGRILIDVSKLRKSEEFQKQKHYGLRYIIGEPLIVKVYHRISDRPNINLEDLFKCQSLPSQAIMDNNFFYGEYQIIGHRALEINEYDMLISYGKRKSNLDDRETVYLQYGLIFKETDISKFNKYIQSDTKNKNGYYTENPYQNESVGFSLKIDSLEQCIAEKSNAAYWNNSNSYPIKSDLRNLQNQDIKKEIFDFFGLDADKSYEENLKIAYR